MVSVQSAMPSCYRRRGGVFVHGQAADGVALVDWAVLRDVSDPNSILFLLLDVPPELTGDDLSGLLGALGLRAIITEFIVGSGQRAGGVPICQPGVARVGPDQPHLRERYPWIVFQHVSEHSVWKQFLRQVFGV